MPSSPKVKRKKQAKKKKKGPKPKRFPGLFLHAILFLFLALPLTLIFLVPTPPVNQVERPAFEDFSKPPPKVPRERPKPPKSEATPHGQRPLVAIIIDDMGYDYDTDRKFISIEAPLSFAFLPYGPNTKRLAGLAHSKRKDVLVHLPMEPDNKAFDPGPGVLTLDMDLDSLLETLGQDIALVPYAIGVNNHMGSRFTQDAKAMEYVMEYIKQKGLFFIDSRTTKLTVAMKVAKELGVPCGQRAVFLDHSSNKREIEHQLRRLVKLAQKNGTAIGIGHPYKNTYEVLYRRLPLIRKDVRLVPVHRIVEHEPHAGLKQHP